MASGCGGLDMTFRTLFDFLSNKTSFLKKSLEREAIPSRGGILPR